jgi:type IV secretory pathway VirB6-like protein
MRLIFSLFLLFLFSFSSYAQTGNVSLPSSTPSDIVELYKGLEDCSVNCEDPSNGFARQAMQYLEEEVWSYDANLANVLNDIDSVFYASALNDFYNQIGNAALEIASSGRVSDQTLTDINDIESKLKTVQARNEETITNFENGGFSGASKTVDTTDFFLSKLMNSIYVKLSDYVFNKVFPALSDLLQLPFILFTTLWLVWVGYSLMMGKARDINIYVKQVLLIALINTFLSSGAVNLFVDWIVTPLVYTGFNLSEWFLAQASESLPKLTGNEASTFGALSYLEYIFARAIGMASFLWNTITDGGFTDYFAKVIKASFVWLTIVATFFFLMISYAFMYIYSVFAMFVLLGLSPIYLLFFAFDKTRGLTLTWLKGLINYILIPVVASIALALTVFVLEETWRPFEEYSAAISGMTPDVSLDDMAGSGEFEWYQLAAVIVVGVVSWVLALRVGDICAFLTGGISTNLGALYQESVATLGKTVALGTAATAASGYVARTGADAFENVKKTVDKFTS